MAVITNKQMCEILGFKNLSTLYRVKKKDPTFPKPIYLFMKTIKDKSGKDVNVKTRSPRYHSEDAHAWLESQNRG